MKHQVCEIVGGEGSAYLCFVECSIYVAIAIYVAMVD